MINPKRIRKLNKADQKSGPVLYWMSRDQRLDDNWAFLTAIESAKKQNQPVVILFCLRKSFLNATIRHYDFMLKGLREVVLRAKQLNYPFYLEIGSPEELLPRYIDQFQVGTVVTDFSPLSTKKQDLANLIEVAMWEVDAHNIVPVWEASDKQEFAARTIRPKILKKLDEFLTDFPKLNKADSAWEQTVPEINWEKLRESLEVDTNIQGVNWIEPGMMAAKNMLNQFIDKKLDNYDEDRNDPNIDALSNISPYLHFGQVSAQRVAFEVTNSPSQKAGKEAFLEELIIRRELSDNYCFYNREYKSFKGLPAWAQKTLNEHRDDIRDYTYSKSEFEESQTHDELWNAAQTEMVKTGKMHGYMRMYWAKKILEWTNSPEEAIEIAIYLNDKYELDGRDPNGYVGIAWSIGGLHDRAWFEREVFGKVRYMNANGAKRKFDVDNYIKKVKML